MDKEKLDLCDSLIKLGKAAVKQKEVVAKYGELGSEEEYVNKKVGASADEYVNRVLPMPKELSCWWSA